MFRVGELIENRYRVFSRMQGGMGFVLLCEDLEWIKNGKPIKIAIKTPFPSSLGRKRSAVDRFLNEALLWVELGKHPNIVQALYVKKIKGMPYIFMEYVQAPPCLWSRP